MHGNGCPQRMTDKNRLIAVGRRQKFQQRVGIFANRLTPRQRGTPMSRQINRRNSAGQSKWLPPAL